MLDQDFLGPYPDSAMSVIRRASEAVRWRRAVCWGRSADVYIDSLMK